MGKRRIVHYFVVDNLVFQLAFGNALFLAMILRLTALLCGAEERAGILVVVTTYTFYMLNQHRRMFVLGLAPDLKFLPSCWYERDSVYLGWQEGSKFTQNYLEGLFWRYFWAPYTIAAVIGVFFLLAAT